MKKIFAQLVLILRKVGVLRYGVKKYKYTSAKDMPAEALMDNVYDAKKDLITKEDLKKLSPREKGEKH
ncbi:hypothetical protein UWK_00725 [Desulfocapsa sulfexigens DSM 10523]|uniref:Uncharacterized protein n=1 Tax=Desulfocapsa sulfexigens (strain DSM 10523 / SB164P1) TaxID=1167006 RepID=M1P1A4_DESSD|nr:hypothetical protein [Desulfocapsa sulfexigens]AGF77303.1 hypothetical protein UWK_00725 [Desulfocapsa sulfexigens DSM 10523]